MTSKPARVFTLLIVLTVSASRAGAQTGPQPDPQGRIWQAALASIESSRPASGGRPANAPQAERDARGAESQSSQSFGHSQPSRIRGKSVAVVLGALGGLFAGAVIGGSLDRHCGCNDPGINGVVVGAPIGAIAGGTLGFILASR